MEVEIKDRFNNIVEMKSEFEKLDFKDIQKCMEEKIFKEKEVT